ncbi:F-box/kelch-repeat protein [Thalictrum thalictroides]|uniref:F-box/kelch-repeat protein n=1 Tax=Thalictrum thalictroides TaxID=46969 RepID=A0A7J6VG32_THATH|nr:F-box/kelch-repeat protein [Thalictrum thalictroides]
MTCKRFKSLAFSESLWQSICTRDWGKSFVDAILASEDTKHQQLSWKKLYQQMSQLGSVNCLRLSAVDDDLIFPTPRASHSLNFVSDCLVLFGGGCEGGRHLDDTWVAYIGNEFKRVLRWQKLASGTPSGRFGHSCAVFSETLVLFGGINDHGIRQNDTWMGQILRDEILGIQLSWRLLDIGSVAPPPRGAHAGCCLDGQQMVIHGGIGLDGLRMNDTWLLDLSNGTGSAAWRQIVTRLSPPARSGHTLTCTGGARMVLFGGRGVGYEVLNDVWLLDTKDEHADWVPLIYNLPTIPKGVPLPRVGHSATLILGGRVLIYGGEDSHRHRKNDFWILDLSALPTVKMRSDTLDPKFLPKKMWKRLKAKGHQPDCRSFHRACANHSGCYVYVFGGMVDGILEPGETSGLRFDGELFLVELDLHP